ncbi:MAG: hypothetical protein EOL88_00560 [Bacteroidia bacterium]|nr:hypothetical protein [Bacteroidia bacterium]
MEKIKPENTGGSWGMTDEVAKVILKRIQPATIVDFGAGLGKYGVIARSVLGPNIFLKGLEVFDKSVEWLKYEGIYNVVEKCDIREWWDSKKTYDLAIFGDVLEHLEENEMFDLLVRLKGIFKYMMIVVPLGVVEQDECGGNPAEKHKTSIYEELFLERLDLYFKVVDRYVARSDDYSKMLITIKLL